MADGDAVFPGIVEHIDEHCPGTCLPDLVAHVKRLELAGMIAIAHGYQPPDYRRLQADPNSYGAEVLWEYTAKGHAWWAEHRIDIGDWRPDPTTDNWRVDLDRHAGTIVIFGNTDLVCRYVIYTLLRRHSGLSLLLSTAQASPVDCFTARNALTRGGIRIVVRAEGVLPSEFDTSIPT